MKPATLATVLGVPFAVAMLFVHVACNNNDDIPYDAFRITPSSVHLARSGDSTVLTAVGGIEPLSWTNLSDLGTLSGSGRTVTFTRGGESGVATVQVTDKRTWTATATIYSDVATNSAAPATLSVSPSSATLAEPGDTAVFVAAGGTEPFAWSLADQTRGHLNATSGRNVIYTRNTDGNNTIILTDASNHVATASIIQAATPSNAPAQMVISTTASSLANDGDMTVLSVTGGTPPYRWSPAPSMASGNILHPATGSQVVYQRDSPGDCAVVVTDATGERAYIVISQP